MAEDSEKMQPRLAPILIREFDVGKVRVFNVLNKPFIQDMGASARPCIIQGPNHFRPSTTNQCWRLEVGAYPEFSATGSE